MHSIHIFNYNSVYSIHIIYTILVPPVDISIEDVYIHSIHRCITYATYCLNQSVLLLSCSSHGPNRSNEYSNARSTGSSKHKGKNGIIDKPAIVGPHF